MTSFNDWEIGNKYSELRQEEVTTDERNAF